MSKVETRSEKPSTQEPVAIVGMSCIFPGAPDLSSFWSNLVAGRSSIRDAGDNEWSVAKYLSKESTDFERFYCTKGGFISEFAEFDPVEHGIMPRAVAGADPDQFLALKTAREAIRDAGYLDASKIYNRQKASVILGRTSAPAAGALNLIQHGQTVDQIIDVLSVAHPQLTAEHLSLLRQELKSGLAPCNADTIPGVMPNIIAGRVATSLGWSGKTLILDAACASSLVAVELGIDDLLSRRSDIVLAGAIHINSNPYFFQMFCGINALSASGEIKPFDNNADGTLLGEGVGWVVMKRLADAIADGDRIYAVVKGVGSSSNGMGTSVLAPSVDGEALAMQRAFEAAGVEPATVGLLEGHGTATRSGDDTELQAIAKIFGTSSNTEGTLSADKLSAPGEPWCALGSVKSNIGHCQAASGMAGLIKAALALHQKIIPPTLNISKPTSKIDWKNFPCYLSVRAKPWIHPWMNASRTSKKLAASSDQASSDQRNEVYFPRRAGVSAFGFGGINAHAILEEYIEPEAGRANLLKSWETELIVLEAPTRAGLAERIDEVFNLIGLGRANASLTNPFTLSSLAYTVNTKSSLWKKTEQLSNPQVRLSIVAASVDELAAKLSFARASLSNPQSEAEIDYLASKYEGIYLNTGEIQMKDGKIAFVLPGLGAAYPGMLSDFCYHFPEVREVFDFVDRLAINVKDTTLPSSMVFPGSPVSVSSTIALAQSHSAVVTVLMAEWALYVLLKNLGIEPDTVLGCSTGEFAAMAISGTFDIETCAEMFYHMSATVARSIPQERVKQLRSLQVSSSYSGVSTLFETLEEPVYLSAELSAQQSIVTGSKTVIEKAIPLLEQAGVKFVQLPVAIPYHTPLVSDALNSDFEKQYIRKYPVAQAKMRAWSCSLAGTYPDDANAVRDIGTQLFKHPVRFSESIEAMYQDGVRVFIELGPKGGLTSSVDKILNGRPHLALAADVPNRTSVLQLHHLLAVLACHGVKMTLAHLYDRRNLEAVDSKAHKPTSATTLKLRLNYPEIKPGPLVASLANANVDSLSTPGAAVNSNSINTTDYANADCENVADEMPAAPQVVSSYLGVTSDFHNQMVAVQQRVMRAYLAGEELPDGDK
jgi:Polyketide synthase modules and related proteins